MKIASQTASTQGFVFKNNEFKRLSYDRNQTISKTSNNQENLIDFNKFQRQMNKLQERIIRQEIEKYESMNLQKQFPSVLKKLQQKSQKLINLQNRCNAVRQQDAKQYRQIESVSQKVQQEKQVLEQKLFNLQYDELLKQQYEKQLILGIIDSSEIKIKSLLEDRQEKMEEKSILNEQKDQLIQQIEKEKEMILNLVVAKANIEQELNFVKHCQIQPIHLIREKSLKSYQAKVKYFKTRFAGTEEYKGFIQNYCQKYENITKIQHEKMIDTQQGSFVIESLVQQQKITSLQNNLNRITSAKLQKTEQINIQLLKTKLLSKQIEQKNQEVKKYQQLLFFVQNQSYCIEDIQESDQIGKKAVNTLELEQKVENQIHQNECLRMKLKQVLEKLNAQKQANQNLNVILSKVKVDHHLRTNKMIAENDVLKSNLETKKKIYEDKIEIKQSKVEQKLITMRIQSKETKNEIKIPTYSSTFSEQKPQTLQSKLSELRGRLMKKFQATQTIKQ